MLCTYVPNFKFLAKFLALIWVEGGGGGGGGNFTTTPQPKTDPKKAHPD